MLHVDRRAHSLLSAGCLEDPDCSDLPAGCSQDSDCEPNDYCQLNGICDATGRCVGECMVRRPPCHKDHECPMNQLCNEANTCVDGTQGCEERYAGDPDCPRTAAAALDPAAVAAALNQKFLSDSTGVLVHWLHGTTEQETGWQFCTDTTDPGCDQRPAEVSEDPDERPPPPRTVICGRSAFSVLNHLAWNPQRSMIDLRRPPDPPITQVHQEPVPPTPGFIGSDEQLASVSCLFSGVGNPAQRGSNGCGRVGTMTGAECAPNCPSSAPASCAAIGRDDFWCSNNAGAAECAMRSSELATLFASRDGYNPTAVVDAQVWNGALPAAIQAFVADTRCMQSSACLDTLREMVCSFRVEFGIDLPVLGLDVKEPTNPFTPIAGFTPPKVSCPANVCSSKDPYPPPHQPWSCDRGEDGEMRCENLADLTAMVGPLNTECCDEPTEDCTPGYPMTCNEGCAAVLLPFQRACSALFNSDAMGFELEGIKTIIDDAAATCPFDGGAAGECADPGHVVCPDGTCAGRLSECASCVCSFYVRFSLSA